MNDLVEPGQPQCGATPKGRNWPVCARPPDNHGGRFGRHESADFMWNDRAWFAFKTSGGSPLNASRPLRAGGKGNGMSFTFAGAGSKADVIRQLRSHHHDPEGLADRVRNLIVAALEEDISTPNQLGGGFVYLAEASGHAGGGAATSINVTIRPVWVPVLAPPLSEADAHDLGIPDSPRMEEGIGY